MTRDTDHLRHMIRTHLDGVQRAEEANDIEGAINIAMDVELCAQRLVEALDQISQQHDLNSTVVTS